MSTSQRPGLPPGYRPQLGPPPRKPRSDSITLADPNKRVVITGLILLLFFTLFSIRLVDVHLIKGPGYAEEALADRLETIPVIAQRGSVTDINGNLIATSIPGRQVIADPSQITDKAGTARLLAPILGLKQTEIEKKISVDGKYALLKRAVSLETWEKIKDLKLAGLQSRPAHLRVYPQGKLASNIIGVVGSEGTGLEGLEYALDHLLKGQDGRYLGEYVAGLEVPGTEVVEVPAIDGTSVTLTIDADIQAVAERVLADRLKTADAKSGDVVVIEPETGHIVAMATAPRFDPDNIKSGDSLGNQAVTDVFEPGSTSKIITMAAAIEEGEMTPLTELTIPSRLKRGGRYFKDHEEHGTLKLTLNGVLAQSSNMGSIMAAEAVGEKKFYRYLQDFGLGKTTKLGFPGESGGLLPDPENWSATTFPTLAFGQGMSVTALQAASIFATIANDGVRIEPTIIAGYTDSNGKYTEADAPKSKQIVSVKTAKQVREMLESVVSSDGTAPLAQIDGYRVAGKTGTAQKYDEELQRYSGYTASFIGMAPAEDPKYVVAVIIHNPVNGHFGGLTSGPVFRDVMTFALAKGKIAPSTTKRPKIPVEW